jgi:ketosteroid isomerase-like protein
LRKHPIQKVVHINSLGYEGGYEGVSTIFGPSRRVSSVMGSNMSEASLAVAARLFEAIEGKNPAAVAALYHDDIAVWHNFSNASQDKATNLGVLTALCKSVAEIHYDVVERLELPDGRILQRHVLRAMSDDGQQTLIPACMLLTITGDKIARIDEYLDTAQANRLRISTGRPPVDA